MAETGKSFIKKVVGFSAVTWVTFALSFISAPISTRLFEPEVMGRINIYSTYSQLFSIFILFGLDQAYARFYNERPNNRSKGYLLTFCFAITYSLVFIIGLIAFPIRKAISVFLFSEMDCFTLALVFVSVFCSCTLRYLNLTYRMEQDIKMYNIQGILMVVASKLVYIIVGFWNPSYRVVLLVSSISHLILTVIFLLIQRNSFERITVFDNYFVKQLFKFAIPLIPVTVISWLNSSIPQLMIQRTMDYYYVGIFNSAMALANVIMIVQSGLNSFWVPYTYENYKTQTGQFFKVYRCMICVLTILALLLVCFQDVIFLLLGPKYRAAKLFFPFLVLGPTCYVIGEVAGVGINISKRTYFNIYVFLASVTVNIVACLLLRIPLGIAGIAMATSLAAITAMLVKTLIGERYYKVITTYKHLVFCIVIIFGSACITLWCPSMTIRLIITGMMLVVSVLFFRKEISEILRVLISFIKK